MIQGLDISFYQKDINFYHILQAGFKFLILRGGRTAWGSHQKGVDTHFEEFYKKAKEMNIPVGCYYYSCARNKDEGIAEAEYFYEHCLKGKQFEYPIYMDVEDTHNQKGKGKELTDAVIGFCEYLENKGYYVGIYASKSWFETELDESRLKSYDKWLAQWTKGKPTYKGTFGMHQFTSNAHVDDYRVDANKCYLDYPSIIKKNGLNGFGKVEEKPQENIHNAKQEILSIIKDLVDKVNDL